MKEYYSLFDNRPLYRVESTSIPDMQRTTDYYKIGEQITVDEKTFTERFENLSNNMFMNLTESGAVLSGGSLNLMLVSKNQSQLSDPDVDLDIFITRGNNLTDFFTRLHRLLKHFAEFAKLHKLNYIFIVRGTLIEIMIQKKRRIQIICANYSSITECIEMLDMRHVQSYYDGKSLYISEKAKECIEKQETDCVRLPVKSTRLQKALERGYNVVKNVYVNKMDSSYYTNLRRLSKVKSFVDTNQSFEMFKKYFLIYDNVDCTMNEMTIQCTRKWEPERCARHRHHLFKYDVDMFDVYVRVENMKSNKGLVYRDTDNENEQILCLSVQDEFTPGIFLLKNLRRSRKPIEDKDTLIFNFVGYQKSTNNCRICVVSGINSKESDLAVLEEFVQGMTDYNFVFRKRDSHFMDTNGKIYTEPSFDKNDIYSCTFKVISLHGKVHFEIIDLYIQTT